MIRSRSLLTPVRALASLLLVLAPLVSASHFRFSEWIWQATGNLSVNFQLNVGFRTSFFFDTPPPLGTVFDLDYINFGDDDGEEVSAAITFVDVAGDYFLATSVFNHTYNAPGPYLAVWTDSARLSSIVNAGDQDWTENTLVTPGIAGSSSLSSALPAVVPVTPTAFTIQIPTNDPAHATFRFATADESSITYVPPELTLNLSTGLLTWNVHTPNFIDGDEYAVQVMLQHMNSSGQVDNYAALDFIIQLVNNSQVVPTFVAPSPAPSTVISATRNCGTGQSFTVNATGANPLSLYAIGLPLTTVDIAFTGGTPTAGQLWTAGVVTFHPTTTATTVLTFQAVDNATAQTAIYSLAFTSTATDVNPPRSTATVTSTATSATVGLLATDDCSGVASLRYTLDGVAHTVTGATGSFPVTGAGLHTVSYYALDVAGNNETVHTFSFTISGQATGGVATAAASSSAVATATPASTAASRSAATSAPAAATSAPAAATSVRVVSAATSAPAGATSAPAAATSARVVTSAPSVRGDPQFVGLRGQSFQVHGLDGAVYALLSSPRTQVNSRFVFLTEGACPVIGGVPATNCWSHPGSYMGQVAVMQRVDGQVHSLVAEAGSAKRGFARVTVDGRPLTAGDAPVAFGSTLSVEVESAYVVVVRVEEFQLRLSNSDRFVNLDEIRPLVALSQLTAHGLLGQTHAATTYASALRYIEGEVDDYLVAEQDLLGSDFLYDQFHAQQE